MSHVFISYSRSNVYERQILVNFLKDKDIQVEYDASINGGDQWREGLDLLIDQSFVVLVILTDAATRSHYVTYEWSRALGRGIPVIPLLFQSEAPRDTHPVLQASQYVVCFPSIPQTLVRAVEEHKGERFSHYVTKSYLIGIANPFRVLMHMVKLYLDLTELLNRGPDESLHELIRNTTIELYYLRYRDLGQFWMNFAHAISPLLRREFEALTGEIEVLHKVWGEITLSLASIIDQRENHTSPIVMDSKFTDRLNEAIQLSINLDDRLDKLQETAGKYQGFEAYQQFKVYIQQSGIGTANYTSRKEIDEHLEVVFGFASLIGTDSFKEVVSRQRQLIVDGWCRHRGIP